MWGTGLRRSSPDLACEIASSSGGISTRGTTTPTYTRGFVESTEETPYPQPRRSNDCGDHGRMSLAAILPDDAKHDHHELATTAIVDIENVWNKSKLRYALSGQQMAKHSFHQMAFHMYKLGMPQLWHSNPRLYFLLYKVNRLDLLAAVLEDGVTDIWLPLHKRLLRRWLDEAETKAYVSYQELALDKEFPAPLQGYLQAEHYSLDSLEDLNLSRDTFPGAGGFGEVYQVRSLHDDQPFACKTMSRPVRYNDHHDLMRNFNREVLGMRRVNHRHCVDLIASCTDQDSVSIIFFPVADMDLAAYMELDLDDNQYCFLETTIGCITSALSHLHSLNIRSVSFMSSCLKPNAHQRQAR